MSADAAADQRSAGAPPPTRMPHVSPRQIAWLRRTFAVLQAASPALAARLAFHLFLRSFRQPARPEDRAVLERARRHRVVSGSDMVEVYEWGSGEHTAVILHGWGSSAARFTGLAALLAERGWRVLVPDAPGHGASPGSSSSLPQFIAALDAIVAHFGPPRALIGHSLGALGIARRHADETQGWASALESVVLISMPSGAPFLLEVYLRSLGISGRTRAHLLDRFERRFKAGIESYAAQPGAGRIAARLLIVHDSADDIVPHAHSEEMRKQLPAATVITTTGLGHSALTRDAETLGRIAEFLERAI
jgi:pimeloyl-ACP methyl ester carboxylesterase